MQLVLTASYESQELVEIGYLSSHVSLNMESLDLSIKDVQKNQFDMNSIE